VGGGTVKSRRNKQGMTDMCGWKRKLAIVLTKRRKASSTEGRAFWGSRGETKPKPKQGLNEARGNGPEKQPGGPGNQDVVKKIEKGTEEESGRGRRGTKKNKRKGRHQGEGESNVNRMTKGTLLGGRAGKKNKVGHRGGPR